MRWQHLTLTLALLANACGGGGAGQPGDGSAVFVFRLRGDPTSEDFRIRSADAQFLAAARAQLALPETGRGLSPHGRVRRGDGSHNAPWRWHLAEAGLAQAHAEGCDGKPSDVERDIAYWADRLGSFCPWSAYVLREET